MNEDFISNYLSYVGETECPAIYHRWCSLSLLGAYLGRGYSFKHGHFDLQPNLYCMLMGVSGARKSTAIKIAKKIILLAGYEKISAEKTSKEKFLLDLAGDDTGDLDTVLNQNLWGESSEAAEMYIACDEFNDFIGSGNVEFISMLGSLWDFTGVYKNRIKSGKSVSVTDPTISILGGNTPINFARAFPPEILGQGFFSRLLLIHGEPTGKKIPWPIEPDVGSTNEIIEQLRGIKATCVGVATISPGATKLLGKIYQTWKGFDDIRFESYCNRRHTHLLKLTLVVSAANFSTYITEDHVIYANTILTFTEHLMPKAMGEFGKSRNSDTAHKIVQILSGATHAMTLTDLWQELPGELDRITELGDIVRNLIASDKVFVAGGGFLIKRKELNILENDVLDYSLLSEEERNTKL